MFALYDDFNDRIISRHRSIVAVVRAYLQLSRHMTKHNPGSFLPMKIVKIESGEIANCTMNENNEFIALLDEFRDSPLSKMT
jgi:hypothetical protein